MPLSNFRKISRILKNQLKRKIAFVISSYKLKSVSNKITEYSQGELRLFVMARNESLRLPYFLDHYFDKGVDRVFLIDNNSTDGTVDIAQSYENVHVFQTKESFRNYSNWMEILLERYGKGHWCVAADVDEILNYPHSESISIRQLTQFLDQQGDTALQCLFLDMYSDKPINKNTYRASEDPLDVCSYFDPDYGEEPRVWTNKKTHNKFVGTRFFGNMRKRVFNLNNISLSKISLFKYDTDVFAVRGMHGMDGVTFSAIQGATMHFKYLQDFNERVVTEVARGEHEGNAADYKNYARKVDENADLNCHYEGSIKFIDSSQLVELGIMKSNLDLDEFVRKKII